MFQPHDRTQTGQGERATAPEPFSISDLVPTTRPAMDWVAVQRSIQPLFAQEQYISVIRELQIPLEVARKPEADPKVRLEIFLSAARAYSAVSEYRTAAQLGAEALEIHRGSSSNDWRLSLEIAHLGFTRAVLANDQDQTANFAGEVESILLEDVRGMDPNGALRYLSRFLIYITEAGPSDQSREFLQECASMISQLSRSTTQGKALEQIVAGWILADVVTKGSLSDETVEQIVGHYDAAIALLRERGVENAQTLLVAALFLKAATLASAEPAQLDAALDALAECQVVIEQRPKTEEPFASMLASRLLSLAVQAVNVEPFSEESVSTSDVAMQRFQQVYAFHSHLQFQHYIHGLMQVGVQLIQSPNIEQEPVLELYDRLSKQISTLASDVQSLDPHVAASYQFAAGLRQSRGDGAEIAAQEIQSAIGVLFRLTKSEKALVQCVEYGTDQFIGIGHVSHALALVTRALECAAERKMEPISVAELRICEANIYRELWRLPECLGDAQLADELLSKDKGEIPVIADRFFEAYRSLATLHEKVADQSGDFSDLRRAWQCADQALEIFESGYMEIQSADALLELHRLKLRCVRALGDERAVEAQLQIVLDLSGDLLE